MVENIRAQSQSAPVATRTRHLCERDYEFEYRLPTSIDLLEIAEAGLDIPAASAELVRRCVVGAQRGGYPCDPGILPVELVARLGEQVALEDPDAEILIHLGCPGCAHTWSLPFDIVSYLWGELEEWVHRVLLDVHTLAGAYGWSEKQVLSLSPTRRLLYVDMVRA